MKLLLNYDVPFKSSTLKFCGSGRKLDTIVLTKASNKLANFNKFEDSNLTPREE